MSGIKIGVVFCKSVALTSGVSFIARKKKYIDKKPIMALPKTSAVFFGFKLCFLPRKTHGKITINAVKFWKKTISCVDKFASEHTLTKADITEKPKKAIKTRKMPFAGFELFSGFIIFTYFNFGIIILNFSFMLSL